MKKGEEAWETQRCGSRQRIPKVSYRRLAE